MIDEKRFARNTVDLTLRKMKYIVDHSSGLSRDEIQQFVRKVWKEKGNKTANGYIKVANRWLSFNKQEKIPYFKEYESFTIKYCSPEEKQRLLDTSGVVGPREKAMFYLLFGTGVRLEEACSLKLQDLLTDKIVVIGKGQKKREIYLPPATRRAISDYLNARIPSDRDHVFTSERGKMTYNYFRKRCERVASLAGIKFHPHMARHTYATELLRRGMSIIYVSLLLGHEDLSSTQVYLHPTQDDAIRAAREMDFFEGNSTRSKDRFPVGPSLANRPDSDLPEKLLLLFFAEENQKGNAIENKGNTTEDLAVSRDAQLFFSPFLADKGNGKRATPAWRAPP